MRVSSKLTFSDELFIPQFPVAGVLTSKQSHPKTQLRFLWSGLGYHGLHPCGSSDVNSPMTLSLVDLWISMVVAPSVCLITPWGRFSTWPIVFNGLKSSPRNGVGGSWQMISVTQIIYETLENLAITWRLPFISGLKLVPFKTQLLVSCCLRIHPRYCLFFLHLKSNKSIDVYKSILTLIYLRSIPNFGLFTVIYAICLFFHQSTKIMEKHRVVATLFEVWVLSLVSFSCFCFSQLKHKVWTSTVHILKIVCCAFNELVMVPKQAWGSLVALFVIVSVVPPMMPHQIHPYGKFLEKRPCATNLETASQSLNVSNVARTIDWFPDGVAFDERPPWDLPDGSAVRVISGTKAAVHCNFSCRKTTVCTRNETKQTVSYRLEQKMQHANADQTLSFQQSGWTRQTLFSTQPIEHVLQS